MRSSALLPRNRVGACSPSTQRIASTTFDLPHPLGPTTAVAPGLKLITVASRNDLKPTNSRLLRRILMPSPPPPHHPCENIPSRRWVNTYPTRRRPRHSTNPAECGSSPVDGPSLNLRLDAHVSAVRL